MASIQVQLASSFDASSVQFSKLRKNKNGGKQVYLSGPGNRKLYLQLPYMRAPFGLSAFTDEATKKTSYSLDLSFDKNDEDVQAIQERFMALDDIILNTVAENSQEWLGKKYNLAVLKEALYKPMVRQGKDDYPATIKLKVMTDPKTGTFVPEAYNMSQEQVAVDSIEKGQKMITIVEVSQIWFIDNKFGVSVRLQQALLEASKKLPSFAFQGVTPAPVADDDEEDILDEE